MNEYIQKLEKFYLTPEIVGTCKEEILVVKIYLRESGQSFLEAKSKFRLNSKQIK
jgi:hypothetical protein